MIVVVRNLYSDKVSRFQGTPDQVQLQLRLQFEWLARRGGESLQDDIARLNAAQAYDVEVES